MIDLKSTYGHKYRVTLDESARDSPRSERPWLYQIPGRYGHVFVWGEDQIAAHCRSNRLRSRLLAVPGVVIRQNGDREFTATFPTDQIGTVATILRCRTRVQLTPERRAELVARLARTRERLPRNLEGNAPPAAP